MGYIFVAECFVFLYFVWRGELRKLTEVAKNPKHTLSVGSRSLKAIEFGTNRKGICDFLLVVNSNIGRYLTRFRSYGDILVKKSTPGHTHLLFNALAKGDPWRI